MLVLANVLVIFVLWSYCNRSYERCVLRYRYECPMRLFALWMQATGAARDFNAFPSNMQYFARWNPTTQALKLHTHPLLCPASNTKPGSQADASQWADYTYINWSKWYEGTNRPPGWYPMAYDRRMANHGGRAIYIIKVDGTVIWDAGGHWLKEFARNYPMYELTLPEESAANER
jgi:hypothetical protein